MKIGVCIRAKDEEKIICDWVRYYINLGFDKIIIYDNLSNPSIEMILNKNNIFNKNIIEIIIDMEEFSNQNKIYTDCINNNKDLDWLLLCDTDEFLYIKNGSIKDFLNIFSDDTATILINWVVYGTSGNATYDMNKTIFEQFSKRENYNHFWNKFVKSFIRPKLINKFGNVHITTNMNYKIKSVYNNILNYSENNKCDYIDVNLSDDTPVTMIHYMTLDYESMMNKHNKNIKGRLLENNCNKYTMKWYLSPQYGFNDNNVDMRMMKYKYII